MFKVVVAYIEPDKFDAVRHDLADSGISHLAVIAAGSVTPDPFAALPYRGSPHTHNLTTKTRLEFVVHADQLTAAEAAIFRHSGEKTFVFTLAVDQVLPSDRANPVGAALEPEPLT